MMNEYNDKIKAENAELVDSEAKRPLIIFKTEADIYGNDIAAMSDFFEGYIQQMSTALMEQHNLELISTLPVDLGIIRDVLHHADIIVKGKVTLLPDFDNLPSDIKTKLKKGLYRIGNSKQVDGNLRAVILDENGTRVKDITLKRVLNNSGNIETARSLGTQIQMRQIYAKLADIQEFQSYQLEKDRDRDIIVPFLDARSRVLKAETKKSEIERITLLRGADERIQSALNAIYADIETTSKRFARLTDIPFFKKQINRYMSYLTSDMQIATKYVGVRMQLLEYIGETDTAKLVLQQYQHVMYSLLTKPIAKDGASAVGLLHDYFPYDKTNMNCWYTFSKEMKPALESGMRTLKSSPEGDYNNEIYIVSVEDAENE